MRELDGRLRAKTGNDARSTGARERGGGGPCGARVTIVAALEPAASDADVIARARIDASAFATIFDRHHATIHAYLRRRLDAPMAEELAAETFVRALHGAARYDHERADALPWLYGIAANLARRHRRTEVRRLRAYARTGIDPLADEHIDTPARLDAAAAGPRLAAALAELRPDDRETLLLLAWAELSYDEIAAALGVPVGTVRSRLHRARRVLRAHLQVEDTHDR
jgi:RNA polymerase sigma-70 factor (ECF subfamily)